jgi:chromosome segregation ATPase
MVREDDAPAAAGMQQPQPLDTSSETTEQHHPIPGNESVDRMDKDDLLLVGNDNEETTLATPTAATTKHNGFFMTPSSGMDVDFLSPEPITKMTTLCETTPSATSTHETSIMDLLSLKNSSSPAVPIISAAMDNATTPCSNSNDDEIQRLQALLQETKASLAAKNEALEQVVAKLQTVQSKSNETTEQLQLQVQQANARVQNFQTDQVRYRELQTSYTTELAARKQAQAQLQETETTLQNLRAVADQQVRELRSLQDEVRLQKALEQQAQSTAAPMVNASQLEQANTTIRELEFKLNEQSQRIEQLERDNETLAAEKPPQTSIPELTEQEFVPRTELDALRVQLQEQTRQYELVQKELAEQRQEQVSLEKDLYEAVQARDEQHRKEIALTNRLNAAKKVEATKSNLAESLMDQVKSLKDELEAQTKQYLQADAERNNLAKELAELKVTSLAKLQNAERVLRDERVLNDERKKKMKSFVEVKAEEMAQAKADNDALQKELVQTNQSFVELNNRWKQLHAQWVQSQTRNRELQRDLNRIKKDSETLHKAGDTLEMKLSRSANETEEHKNKRMAAKHELMTVLRTLENEREATSKLRDSIKFTFTPKALSQQQLIREAVQDFDAQLLLLSQRLRKPLPPTDREPLDPGAPHQDTGSSTAITNDAGSPPLANNNTADDDIAALDYETQRVSQKILALSNNVERLQKLLAAANGAGDRTCTSSIFELLTSGGISPVAPAPAITNGDRPLYAIRSPNR